MSEYMSEYAYKRLSGFYKIQIKSRQTLAFGSNLETVRADREIILDTDYPSWGSKITRTMGSIVDGFIPQPTVSDCISKLMAKATQLINANGVDRRYQELYSMKYPDSTGLAFSFYIKLI